MYETANFDAIGDSIKSMETQLGIYNSMLESNEKMN